MRQDSIPSGTVTFLFTDIEGSTKLWESHPELMRTSLARHDAIVRHAIQSSNGHVFKTIGDAFCAAFATAPAALDAALNAQIALKSESWPGATPVRVRMAIHTGAVENRDEDYFGPPLNRVVRLLSTAHGGQTLLSQTTFDLVRDFLPQDASILDLGIHQLKDLARPEQVFQLLHPALPAEFPPLRSLSNQPNNLPQQLTTFIGREKEVEDLQALLKKNRLLTLSGSGGTGKSRLSLQIAANVLEEFPDGAWLVELAPLSNPSLVASAVASVLSVKEEVGTPVINSITEQLKPKKLLLVLDNCEHLLDACAKVADALLRNCPGVRILASSREQIGVAGEQTYRVPSLSLPDPGKRQTAESLSLFESVRLFVDRAVLAKPGFAVTNQNAASVASVCFHLDGIPLAIELAAARVRGLAVEEIDDKLDQRFRLLTGGSRTALPRQQTLRSLIDWSYDLLNETEQALLCRLSVFAGGWTLESAEQVCEGGLIDEFDIMNLMTSLEDKSLVVATTKENATRFHLLETVRQYSRDRLAEGDEAEAWRTRHLKHFLTLAEEAEPELSGPQQQAWLTRLEAEHDNLRAAHDWSCGTQEVPEAAVRIAGALSPFWLTRSHLFEGRTRLARSLARAPRADTAARAKALAGAGTLAWNQGDYAETRVHLEESLDIYRRLEDQGGIARALSVLGPLTVLQGDSDGGRVIMEESLAIYRALGDRRRVALALGNLGALAVMMGDNEAARTLQEESLAVLRELGDRMGSAIVLVNLGEMAHDRGDFAEAKVLVEESLSLSRESGDQWCMAQAMDILGMVDLERGEDLAAQTLLTESLSIRRELGDRQGIAVSLELHARLNLSLSKIHQAARLWGAAEQLREEMGAPMPANSLPKYEAQITSAREAIGDVAAFDSAWAEGRKFSMEQAIDLALDA
ncbi:MAG: tetratricopeptide repeat protein [Armatimonadetes bacterium]|nr:tetratricopeptide repeat protein [Armatimonadota bacterium]